MVLCGDSVCHVQHEEAGVGKREGQRRSINSTSLQIVCKEVNDRPGFAAGNLREQQTHTHAPAHTSPVLSNMTNNRVKSSLSDSSNFTISLSASSNSVRLHMDGSDSALILSAIIWNSAASMFVVVNAIAHTPRRELDLLGSLPILTETAVGFFSNQLDEPEGGFLHKRRNGPGVF
jgi:hypothetical protein